MQLLKYDSKTKAFNFQKNGKNILDKTYTNLTSFSSTYSIQFSVRYIFN